MALTGFGFFLVWAGFGWAVNPDFIFHWGVKGHRFFLAGGIDTAFLVQPWMWYAHPGYPNLLPELFAATAVAGGGWREPAMFVWSVVFAIGTWPAARQVMGDLEIAGGVRQTSVAALGLVSAMFGIGFFMAGGPDTIMALAPLLAWPAMIASRRVNASAATLSACDLQVGLAAALAAGSKMEGMPLALFITGVYLLRCRGLRRESGSFLAALSRLAVPTLAVASLWAVRGSLSGLFTERHAGGLHLDRLPTVLYAAADAAQFPEWHKVSWVVLLLPLLFLLRRTHALAAILLLQLATYIAVYLTAPMMEGDALTFYVRSSFPRLLFHLVPATLVAALVLLDGWTDTRRRRRSG